MTDVQHRRILSLIAITMAARPALGADTVQPFLHPSNFALVETQSPYVSEHSTGDGSNWDILAWGQQGGAIWEPFSITDRSRTDRIYTTSSLKTARDPMSISLEQDPATGGWTSTTLTQSATSFCGSPFQEFDLYLQPNSRNLVSGNPSGILPAGHYEGGAIPSLDEISNIQFHGKATLVNASQSATGIECGVNQSIALVGLILNSKSGQTLFYLLNLAQECYPGTEKGLGCYGNPAQEYFSSASDPYVIDDPVTSYGASFIADGGTLNLSGINIAPRLKDLIESGSPGGTMDNNPADWKVTDMFIGQECWGNSNFETKWSGEILLSIRY